MNSSISSSPEVLVDAVLVPETDREVTERLRSVVVQHSLVAVLVPFVVVATTAAYVHVALLAEFFAAPPAMHLIVLAVVAMIRTASENALSWAGTGAMGARVRELVLVLLGAYAAMVLIEGGIFRGEFAPGSSDYVYPTLLVLIEWLTGYAFLRMLRPRRLFTSLVAGKEGRPLFNAVRDASAESKEVDAALRTLRRVLVAVETANVIFLVAVNIAVKSPPTWVAVGAVAHTTVCSLALVAVGRWAEMHRITGAGVVPDADYRRRRNGGALLVIAVAAVAAVFVSRSEPVIPPRLIGDALVGLNERLNRRQLRPSTVGMEFTDAELGADDLEAFRPTGDGEARERSDLAARIARIVGICIALALGGGVVAFLILPLIRRLRERTGAPESLRDRLVGVWRRVAESLARLGEWLRRQRRAVVESGQAVLREVRAAHKERVKRRMERTETRERLRAIRGSYYVRELLKVVRWAERRGVDFHRHEGASRFLDRVRAKYPDLADRIETIRGTFERGVYSSHEVDEAERTRYAVTIQELTRIGG